MSMTDVEPSLHQPAEQRAFDEAIMYRAVNRSAVMALALGFVSIAGLLFPTLLILAGLGVVLGVSAMRTIRRYPEEWSGLGIARVGALLCAVVFVGGLGFHAAVYALEVPEGYHRISFADLQPDDKIDSPVPPAALQLDGQKVFIKGYVYPDGQQGNIQRFVLVPDRGTCCFGGQPKLTDMVEVNIRTDDRIRYSFQMRKLAGVLRVDDRLKPVSGLGGVYYQLEADYVK